MTFDQLIARAEAGEVPPVCVLTGSERVLVERALAALKRAALGDGPAGFNDDLFQGQGLSAQRVTQALLGVFKKAGSEPKKHIKEFRLPDGMTAQMYLERRSRLFSLYDALLPQFAAGVPANHVLRREFEALFWELSEPPFLAIAAFDMRSALAMPAPALQAQPPARAGGDGQARRGRLAQVHRRR